MSTTKKSPHSRSQLAATAAIAVSAFGLLATMAITCGERLAGPATNEEDVTWNDAGDDLDESTPPATSSLSIGVSGTYSEITSNFNGTAIPAGRTIWFSAVANVQGPTASPFTVHVQNAVIRFSAGGTDHTVHVPNTMLTFDPNADLAATTYNTVTDTWETLTPFGLSGNMLFMAAAFPVAANLPGGIKNVVWSAEFSATEPEICASWKWGAAVYTQFTNDLNAVGVKVCDDGRGDVYANSHHAGTPENYRSFVVGGARGGGGSNWTGSYSGTKSVCDLPLAPDTPGGEEIAAGDPGAPGSE